MGTSRIVKNGNGFPFPERIRETQTDPNNGGKFQTNLPEIGRIVVVNHR